MRSHYARNTTLSFCLFLICALLLGACGSNPFAASPPPTPTSQPAVNTANNAVRLGILAIRSAVATNNRYDALRTYLAEAIGRPVKMVPLTQETQFSQVKLGALEFIFTNPLASVQIRRLHRTTFLATMSLKETGAKIGGLIIVRSDSGIKTLEDLRGKRGACVNFQTAAAGCAFQVYHLQQKGLDPYKDFASFVEIPSQDSIVLAVLNRSIDVGFVRTGQIETMLAEGTLTSLEELSILDQVQDGFFYPHTTRLYPEWPFAAAAHTDPALAEKVRTALLNLPPNHPAIANTGIDRFMPAEDYTAIDELIEALHLPGWEAPR